MKAFLFAALLLSSASIAQADGGRCLAIDPVYQDVCDTFIIEDACNARGLMCRWLEMNVLGKLPVVNTAVVVE